MFRRCLPAGQGATAEIVFTDASEGDFRIEGPVAELAARRQSLMEGQWTWLRQAHGAKVVAVTAPGEHSGEEADASVTMVPGAILAVQTADCVPVVLVGSGAIGIAHTGWKGLIEGILPAAAAAMGRLTDGPIEAILGPCIGPASYEFGEPDLAKVEAVAGVAARSVTRSGQAALDMAGAASSILRGLGIDPIDDVGLDTADQRWYSHRTRGDLGRQVTVVRLVPR